jgi:ATP:ADP antiporter, AAA family
MPTSPQAGTAVLLASVGAGAVIGQFVAGKAARDALFLSNFEVTSLPLMVMGASIFSIVLALLMSRALGSLSPARLVPATFIASAVLILAEWSLVEPAPRLMAVLFYLHMLGLAPVLVSGFWSVVSERFDPRTARKRIGQIAGAATVGGIVGSITADRVAVWSTATSVLPLLAAANVFCAVTVRRLAETLPARMSTQERAISPESGFRVLARVPHLRNLAALVLLTTLGATLIDYVFKASAVAELGQGDRLLRFFALYYGAASALTFVAQLSVTRLVLEKLGLASAAASPSFAIAAGSLGALVAPGLPMAAIARGSESISRMSVFKSAYELLFTPVPRTEKRAVKTVIDVGFDRVGDLLGGGATRLMLAVVPAAQHSAILVTALFSSVLALLVARRLTHGYIRTLETSLLDQAVHIDLSDVADVTTRTTMLGVMKQQWPARSKHHAAREEVPVVAPQVMSPVESDVVVAKIAALRSRDKERILRVLHEGDGLEPMVVPHVIQLLAWDAIAPDAIHALRKVAEESVGQLVDALLNPDQDFAIRRRVARVLSVCVSQRAVDGLMLALDDRFEVRFQCGRSLAAIADRNLFVELDPARVFEVVRREVGVSRSVWESQRLLDGLEAADETLFVDQFIRDRAGQSLAHVFTLLSLVLPREPLQIAFRGLHVSDPQLRGTALEYLESVLPASIRDGLWPFLEESRPKNRQARTRQEIVADLLRSNHSIMVNLAELEEKDASRSAKRLA